MDLRIAKVFLGFNFKECLTTFIQLILLFFLVFSIFEIKSNLLFKNFSFSNLYFLTVLKIF